MPNIRRNQTNWSIPGTENKGRDKGKLNHGSSDPIPYPKFVTQITKIDNTKNIDGNYWSGDLGVMSYHYNLIYMFLGDVTGSNGFIPNCFGSGSSTSSIASNSIKWKVNANKDPVSFSNVSFNSTFPVGAVSIDTDYLYVYMANVSWSDNRECNAILIKSIDSGSNFSTVWSSSVTSRDNLTSSPVCMFPMITGCDAYCYYTTQYRSSSVKLSYFDVQSIEVLNDYQYLADYVDGSPSWSAGSGSAIDLFSSYNNIGEVCCHYNNYLSKYVLSFFNHAPYGQERGMYLSTSSYIYGPWSNPKIAINTDELYDWYRKEQITTKSVKGDQYEEKYEKWTYPYGGYILQQLNPSGTNKIWSTVTLASPFITVLVELDLDQVLNN